MSFCQVRNVNLCRLTWRATVLFTVENLLEHNVTSVAVTSQRKFVVTSAQVRVWMRCQTFCTGARICAEKNPLFCHLYISSSCSEPTKLQIQGTQGVHVIDWTQNKNTAHADLGWETFFSCRWIQVYQVAT